jgi:type II secretion system protein G
MNRRLGFTLIELLVVIAIIGILAAIIFPVMARARDSAYRNADITSMNTLRNALQVYRVDQGAYPPAILGYATLYMTGPNAGNVVPADQVRSFLYPRRVPNVETFRPAHNRVGANQVGTAVWPNQDPRPVGSAPILDLNGDGALTAADDPAGARQAFGPTTTVQRRNAGNPAENIGNQSGDWIDAYFYRVSGYDASPIPQPAGGIPWELRYALFWTEWGVGGGNAMDDPRQLGYNDPPDSTVLTWNSFYRDYTNNLPQANRRDIVLFLGGAARPYDSRALYDRSWRVMP